MLDRIKLSTQSQDLSRHYFKSDDMQSDVSFSFLLDFLCDDKSLPLSIQSKEETELVKTTLFVSLLGDLFACLPGNEVPEKVEEISWSNRLQFVFWALTGTLVAACQGFDSVATILSLCTFIPSWVILVVGISFAIFSVAVFYSLELFQVSQVLGVKLMDTSKLLDIYLLELNEIKRMRRKIMNYRLAELTLDELDQIKRIVSMLQIRLNAITKDSEQFDKALNSIGIKIAHIIFSGVTGLLFFGGGFLAGQTVALFVLSLFMTAVSPTFLPVILFSVVVGLAALSLYWCIQHGELNKIISGWFGLDANTIAQLSDVASMEKQNNKLEQIKANVMGFSQLREKINPEKLKVEESNYLEPPQKAFASHRDGLFASPLSPFNDNFVDDQTLGYNC